MSVSPVVSVIIPVYNVGELLSRAIESLLGQTFGNWEAICVDDGSSDASGQILDEFAQRDSRIKVIHQQNGGVSSARNCGLEHAVAPYVTMLDADDFLQPETLEKLCDIMQNHDCDLVCCTMQKIYADGRREIEIPRFESGLHEAAPADVYRFAMRSPCCKLYKRAIIEAGRIRFPLGIPVCEDDVFVVSYWFHVRRFYMLDEALYNYKQSESSVLRKLGNGQLPYECYRATLDVPVKIYRYFLSLEPGKAVMTKWCRLLLKSQFHIGMWMIECNANREERERLRLCVQNNVEALSKGVSIFYVYYIRCYVNCIRRLRRFLKVVRAKIMG